MPYVGGITLLKASYDIVLVFPGCSEETLDLDLSRSNDGCCSF